MRAESDPSVFGILSSPSQGWRERVSQSGGGLAQDSPRYFVSLRSKIASEWTAAVSGTPSQIYQR